MKFPFLALIFAAAISSPAFAQGAGDAGNGGGGSRANYDYSYRFPGEQPQNVFEGSRPRGAPAIRRDQTPHARR
ncbi:hypothetical protein [Phreatobacter stygius]|uniref:Uncharacterized protein n=1 Tax=Phreatobacter stygius TaxID=1940610 RepID=A0A4D7B047_9HYPH|nr:hypothetical protein [Phreatobacter stygius]QCI67024.1 hypothetical protein E8M01_23915 [Phreatobacter stygius]